jgi:hypothetical protein
VLPLREAVLLAREDDVLDRDGLPAQGRVELVALGLGDARVGVRALSRCSIGLALRQVSLCS